VPASDPAPSRRRATTVATHYEQARRALEGRAVALAERGVARLPAEDQLAEDLGFSRPTIRSALLAMQLEGKVARRHGIGTFINRHALAIRANLAEDLPFLEVIERLGESATLEIARLASEPLAETVTDRLGLPQAEEGVVIDRLFRASGRPVVFSRDHVPARLLHTPVTELTAGSSTFAFLGDWTGRTIRYSVAAIHAVAAPAHVATSLEIPFGSPVLVLNHLHIDEGDEPVGVTEAYVRDGDVEFSVVRTGPDL
jgi:GntR family transcriptional regulator